MAYDDGVAERLREVFAQRHDQPGAGGDAVLEKKMFGGLAFMVAGHMCCGVVEDTLMARVGPTQYEDALHEPHACEMDFTGKPLTGFVYVAPPGFESDQDLGGWLDRCLAFVASLPPK